MRMMAAWTTSAQAYGTMFMLKLPAITTRIRAPMTVPPTGIRPPASDVPPIAAAAMR